MALTSGTRLGPYEIVAPIGAGGMGEVYRARDTRLDRTVAIKVLPGHLSSDPALRQRFEREAKAISALQHPHICTLHDVGSENDIDFLVMEHLEGQTLADRLTKGPLPCAQVKTIAIEIAQALQEAHRRGIVHRDLKPANIMLTKSGAKLMDFGLAKPDFAMPAGASGPFTPSSPTMNVAGLTAVPSPLTQKGTFMGTCQYMAPEALEGNEADARSDIFSFGCVLYEMVTGRKAFEAKSQLGVLTAILEKDPEPIRTVTPVASPALERIVSGCLIKDPCERFQSMHDVMMDLRWMPDEAAEKPATEGTGFTWRRVAWLAAYTMILVAAAGIAGLWWAVRSEPEGSFHAEIAAPDGSTMDSTGDAGGMPVLSPQGDKIAFVAHSPSTKMLWVRSLDSDTAQPLDGTQNAMHPFWSPDGKFLAFFANGKLNRIAVTGGSVTPLADVTNPRGGSWGSAGVILFTPNILNGLMQVPASGGAATEVTDLVSGVADTHRWPWFMPDGKHFVYLSVSHTAGDTQKQGIYFSGLDSRDTHFVVATNAGAQFAAGHLLYHLNNDLVAQPFDPVAGTLSGTPVILVNNIRNDSGVWRAVFSTSQNGMLIYQLGAAAAAGTRLAMVDRQGKEVERVSERQNSAIDVRLSPDGKRVVIAESTGIWVEDIARKTRTRITYDAHLSEEPSWSPDGKTIVFATGLSLFNGLRSAETEIRSVPADGSGTEKLLLKAQGPPPAPSWSSDGKYLAYIAKDGDRSSSLWIQPANGEGPATVALRLPTSRASMWDYRISSDSHWVAYESDESGQSALYIARFPEGTGKWRVSGDTGAYPAWTADDKEIFYKDFNDDFWVCPLKISGTEMEVGTPQKIFHANQPGLGIPFDVTPDGQHVLVNLAEDEVMAPLKVMTHWTNLLKK